jgi:hypothetical protein
MLGTRNVTLGRYCDTLLTVHQIIWSYYNSSSTFLSTIHGDISTLVQGNVTICNTTYTHTHAHTHVQIPNSDSNQSPSWGNNTNYLTRPSFVQQRQEYKYFNHHPIVQHTHEFVYNR